MIRRRQDALAAYHKKYTPGDAAPEHIEEAPTAVGHKFAENREEDTAIVTAGQVGGITDKLTEVDPEEREMTAGEGNSECESVDVLDFQTIGSLQDAFAASGIEATSVWGACQVTPPMHPHAHVRVLVCTYAPTHTHTEHIRARVCVTHLDLNIVHYVHIALYLYCGPRPGTIRVAHHRIEHTRYSRVCSAWSNLCPTAVCEVDSRVLRSSARSMRLRTP